MSESNKAMEHEGNKNGGGYTPAHLSRFQQPVRPEVASYRETPTRVMAFASGKGGVGKSQLILSTAISLAERGKSVLLLDGDIGLANINVLLGIQPRHTLADYLRGERSLEECIVRGPSGIEIIPGISAQKGLNSLSLEHRLLIMQGIEEVAHRYDYLLIDTQAGIGPEVLYFAGATSEVVCVVTPEPTSLTDAYALIKTLCQSKGQKHFSVIMNAVESENQGKTAFKRLHSALERFLHVKVELLGFIPLDSAFRDAVTQQSALSLCFPSSAAARAIESCAARIDDDFRQYSLKGGMQFFFRRLLEV